MLASSRKPCHTANPRRRAKSPALHCGRERAAADERLLSVKPAGGPMKSSAPTQGRAAACYPRRCCPPAYIVGRAISPAAWGLRYGRVCGTMQASSPTDAGQVSGKFCRISPPQGGNAPLSLRLAAHPAPLAGEPFQTAVTRKAGKTNTARNTAVPGCIVLYRDPGQGVLIRKSLRQTADGTSPPMGGNLAPKRRTLPAQIVLEGRCVKFNHLRAVKKQWITGGCACAGQPDRRQRQPRRAR